MDCRKCYQLVPISSVIYYHMMLLQLVLQYLTRSLSFHCRGFCNHHTSGCMVECGRRVPIPLEWLLLTCTPIARLDYLDILNHASNHVLDVHLIKVKNTK